PDQDHAECQAGKSETTGQRAPLGFVHVIVGERQAPSRPRAECTDPAVAGAGRITPKVRDRNRYSGVYAVARRRISRNHRTSPMASSATLMAATTEYTDMNAVGNPHSRNIQQCSP